MSWFLENLGYIHQEALKWVLRYFNGSLKGGLNYTKSTSRGRIFEGFCKFRLCSNMDTHNSYHVFVFTLFGTTIIWKTNR